MLTLRHPPAPSSRYHLTIASASESIGVAPDAPLGHYGGADCPEVYVADLADLAEGVEPTHAAIVGAWRQQGAIETGRDIWALQPEAAD